MDFGVRYCRSWRSLRIVVYIVPLIPIVIIMGDSAIHPNWHGSGWRMAYLPCLRLVAFVGNMSLQ